jgi:mannose-6-phosphate isomerase-like protein (cupin superfamily)
MWRAILPTTMPIWNGYNFVYRSMILLPIIFDGSHSLYKLRTINMEAKLKQQPINLLQKCSLISEHWNPRVVAEMNDYQFKVVKIEGDFVWHEHADTDEAFFVIEGELRIDFRNGSVNLRSGEMFVVPRGVEHKPFAQNEVKMMLIEPKGVFNTGDSETSDITAENDQWI